MKFLKNSVIMTIRYTICDELRTIDHTDKDGKKKVKKDYEILINLLESKYCGSQI